MIYKKREKNSGFGMVKKFAYGFILCFLMGIILSSCGKLAEHGSSKGNGPVCTVIFDMNDGSGNVLSQISLKADEYITEDQMPEIPEREGYYFAGWHTKSDITSDDIEGGVSNYLYYFGESKSAAGVWNKDFESVSYPVSQMDSFDSSQATLYARWVELKKINNEEELWDIRNDLYGAYQLGDDITLTREWDPIGSYYSNYELLNSNWWIHSFHGYFDGNGKTIRNMNIRTSERNVEEGFGKVVDEGSNNAYAVGLFGSIADHAIVENLTISDATIGFTQDIASCYTGTLIGFQMGGTVRNITIDNTTIQVEVRNDNDSKPYISVAGLVGGFWSGEISNCSGTGSVNLDIKSSQKGSGEVYLGGLVGECFAPIQDSTAEFSIDLNASFADDDKDTATVLAGGIAASNCYMDRCTGENVIRVNVQKESGPLHVVSALGVASERYGHISDITANGTLLLNTTDQKDTTAYAASILGEFEDSVYSSIGAMFDSDLKVRVVENCTTNNRELPFVGAPYKNTFTAKYTVENVTVVE